MLRSVQPAATAEEDGGCVGSTFHVPAVGVAVTRQHAWSRQGSHDCRPTQQYRPHGVAAWEVFFLPQKKGVQELRYCILPTRSRILPTSR